MKYDVCVLVPYRINRLHWCLRNDEEVEGGPHHSHAADDEDHSRGTIVTDGRHFRSNELAKGLGIRDFN